MLLHSGLLNFLFFPLNAFSLEEGKQKTKTNKQKNLKSLLLLSVYKVGIVTVKK